MVGNAHRTDKSFALSPVGKCSPTGVYCFDQTRTFVWSVQCQGSPIQTSCLGMAAIIASPSRTANMSSSDFHQ